MAANKTKKFPEVKRLMNKPKIFRGDCVLIEYIKYNGVDYSDCKKIG
jgi:hypothetical protein